MREGRAKHERERELSMRERELSMRERELSMREREVRQESAIHERERESQA